MTDRFEELRTFVTVVSSGGISAAAAELGIAKSAVSRRVSDLEGRLGLDLLERSGKRTYATAVGLEYARRAAEILGALRDLETPTGGDATRRIVSIAAPPLVASRILVPAIQASAAPGKSDTVFRLIEEGAEGADVTFLLRDEARAQDHLVLVSPLIVCGSPRYLAGARSPRRMAELEGHAAIIVGTDPAADWRFGERTWRPRTVAMVASNLEVAAAAAIAGLGLVRIPESLVLQDISEGRLVPVLADEPMGHAHLYAHAEASAEMHVLACMDRLVSLIGSTIGHAVP
ncbi:LysR family transcriptional regulator [Sphingomonas aquatilis NBRC 16722]|uniref:DNA-binding transcriptional LysR family regulator n=1 Tax=Sphingomonas aquatilis TaxID=93063 RepID=A0AAW3TYN8_9SPHN|nr:LysR family transcriptional regulator [Sphingomonas aquatilis]MBB3876995.1 DNA-binding transcriptional LysR family regulator [Sphingomonas aquatilis]GEM72833.1 LysR family transcriptional regulator [Sphingomonas aquatilis NBRC 16722]